MLTKQKIFTQDEILTRILFRKDRLVRLGTLPKEVIQFEELIIRELERIYMRRQNYLNLCMGITR